MTGETECVVSFVGGSTQQQRLEAAAGTGGGGGAGNWLSRLAISYQAHQRKSKKKEQSYNRGGPRRREGGGGGKRRGMFLRFLIDLIRTILFIFRQVLLLVRRKVRL